MIIRVSQRTNSCACIRNAMVMPKSRVMILEKVVCAVSDSDFSTPHSRIRLPNISMPTRDREAGAISPATTVTIIGKRIRVSLLTCFAL